MHLTPDSITEHREATMPEILARNAEYEALPENVKLLARVRVLTKALDGVWGVARTMPPGKERDALLAFAETVDMCPVEYSLQNARYLQ